MLLQLQRYFALDRVLLFQTCTADDREREGIRHHVEGWPLLHFLSLADHGSGPFDSSSWTAVDRSLVLRSDRRRGQTWKRLDFKLRDCSAALY